MMERQVASPILNQITFPSFRSPRSLASGVLISSQPWYLTLAVAWHLRGNLRQSQFALMTGSLLLWIVAMAGWARLSTEPPHSFMTVGLTVIPEKQHLFPEKPVLTDEQRVADTYIEQITSLADQGAEIVLFPEKCINTTESQKTA